ncbi:MAG TPA: diguanylate cyclase [Chloroflexia bacterium]|nr:diguanylate cyclase [Chloroflexia bacterium]
MSSTEDTSDKTPPYKPALAGGNGAQVPAGSGNSQKPVEPVIPPASQPAAPEFDFQLQQKPGHQTEEDLPQEALEIRRLKRHYAATMRLMEVANTYKNQADIVLASLQTVAELVEVEFAVLCRFDPDQRLLLAVTPVYSSLSQKGSLLSSLENLRINLDEPGLAARVFLSKQISYHNYLKRSSASENTQASSSSAYNTLIAPLIVDQKVEGLCILVNKRAGEFETHDVQEMQALTPALANLLKNFLRLNHLEQQERRNLAVLEAAVDGYVEVNRDLRIIHFSTGAENLTGLAASNALGRTCTEVLMPHSPEGEALCNNCPLQRSFQYGVSVTNVETLIRNHESEETWVSCSYTPVRNAQKQIVSGVITIKDIYRLKALSEELRQQAQQQESLLGVNNAINGLSNIEEIYRVSLDEISNAIGFDLGAIHSINPESQELMLMSFMEKEKESSSPEGFISDEERTQRLLPISGLLGVRMNKPGLALGGIGLSLDDEDDHTHGTNKFQSHRANANGYRFVTKDIRWLESHIYVHDCEALRQNEAYMSVNMPGKTSCLVLKEFKELQSHLCVPIKTQERTYGVLHLASRRPYAFWGSDFMLAVSICKQIAVAAERAHLFEQVNKLARTDPLTGLYNKREFWERIEREVRRADRRQSPLSLIMIDLDRLKWINDCFGHSQGDLLLARLGELIRRECRSSDIAFRYGGDELCIILPDTNQDEAKVAADRLRREARLIPITSDNDPIVIGDEGRITMSVGIACYPHDADSPAQLFENADTAMYRAKETGKDRSVIFDGQIDRNRLNYRRRADIEYKDDRLLPPHS